MSTGIDIEFIRESYRKMTDRELMRIATVDGAGLTDEAQIVAKEEIKRRNIDPHILKGIDAQNKTYTDFEIDIYCQMLRKLNCPSCGSSLNKLNGTMTAEVISFIWFSQYQKKLKIACPDCLDLANDKAITKTCFLGWWSIHGFIYSIKAVIINSKNKKTNHLDEPNEFLQKFTLSRIGEIEIYKNDNNRLQQIISIS